MCSRRRHRSRRREEPGDLAWGTARAEWAGQEPEQEQEQEPAGPASAKCPSAPSPQSVMLRWAWSPNPAPAGSHLSPSTTGFWHPRLPKRLWSHLEQDSKHFFTLHAGLDPQRISLGAVGVETHQPDPPMRKEWFSSCWAWHQQKLPALGSFRRAAKSRLTASKDQPRQGHKGAAVWVHHS